MSKSAPKPCSVFFPIFTASIFLISTVFAQHSEASTSPHDGFNSMLEAINKIRERRDIKLDCSNYVAPFLGQSGKITHYIDLFSANGINPVFVRQRQKYHVGFEIAHRHLSKVQNSKFGRRDSIFVVFVVDRENLNSPIESCSGTLRAAPDYL